MKIAKIATFCLAALGVLFLGRAAYSYLGGQQPSKNMGNYKSFSFYSDVSGNAATAWMQPGNAPNNPLDQFWFDPNGNFSVAGGLNAPGPVALGSNSITANSLAQLTADAYFNGTVYLTAPVTLTQNLTTTCDLRPLNGAVISAPVVQCQNGATVTTPTDTGTDTVSTSGTSATVTFSGSGYYNLIAPGATLTSNATTVTVTAMNGYNTLAGQSSPTTITVTPSVNWASGSTYTYCPMSTTVTISSTDATDINAIQVGSVLTANGQSVVVVSKSSNVLTVSQPVNWSAGYSFTYTTATLTINGPFHAGSYQCFSNFAGVVFAPKSTKTIEARWFGVAPDSNGTHGSGSDNGCALYQTVMAAQASGIAAHLPAGIIRTTRSLVFTGAGLPLTIYGGGPSITEIYEDFDDEESGLTFSSQNGLNLHSFKIVRYNTGMTQPAINLHLQNITGFSLNSLDSSGNSGFNFELDACTNGVISHCKVHDGIVQLTCDGIHLEAGCSHIQITDNQVWNFSDDAITLFSDYAGPPITDINVTNNIMYDSYQALGTISASGTTATLSSSTDYNNLVVGCLIKPYGQTVVRVTALLGNNQVTLSGPETWNSSNFSYTTRYTVGNGIKVGQGSQGVVVSHNNIMGFQSGVICLSGEIGNPSGAGFTGQNDTKNISILDNTISDGQYSGSAGIEVDVAGAVSGYSMHDIDIKNNTLRDCDYGIYTFTSTPASLFIPNVNMVGNTISDITVRGILEYNVINPTIKSNILSNMIGEAIHLGLSAGKIVIDDNYINNWNTQRSGSTNAYAAIQYCAPGGYNNYFSSQGTISSTASPSSTLTLSNYNDYEMLSIGDQIVASGTTVTVQQLLGNMQVLVNTPVSWSSLSFEIFPTLYVQNNRLTNVGGVGTGTIPGYDFSYIVPAAWIANNSFDTQTLINYLPAGGTYCNAPWNVFPTTVNGTTAGSVTWTEPNQGISDKRVVLNFSGYENTTATAQTITIPLGFGENLVAYGSCPGNSFEVSGATVTLPYGMSSTFTGLCIVEGQ